MEEEEAWPADVPPELVAYARELAVSADQVVHWVSFFTTHPQGRQAWEEIQPLWKASRRVRKRK
jgi:hypothetical protein